MINQEESLIISLASSSESGGLFYVLHNSIIPNTFSKAWFTKKKVTEINQWKDREKCVGGVFKFCSLHDLSDEQHEMAKVVHLLT